MNFQRINVYRSFTLAVLFLLPLAVQAAAWIITPLLDVATTYTDNVALAPKGAEQEEYIFLVAPGFEARANGHELDLSLIYSYQSLFYLENDSRNNARQQLQGNASVILMPDLFFVNATGSITQQSVNPAGAGVGHMGIAQNADEVRTWVLSPYIHHALGSSMEFIFGANLDWVDYNGEVRDSYGRELHAEFKNGIRESKYDWSLNYSARTISYETEQSDIRVEQMQGKVRYHMNIEWALVAAAGYVNNDYAYNPLIAQSPEGETWTVGIAWTPSLRTHMEVGSGQHTFGSTRYGLLSHRSAHTSLLYSYTEEISTRRQLQVDYALQQQNDPQTHQPQIDPNTGQPVMVLYPFLAMTDEAFVSAKSSLQWSYRRQRSSLSLNGVRDQRELQSSGGTETIIGAGMELSWQPTTRSVILARYNKQIGKFANEREDHYYDTSVEARRNFSQKTHGSLEFIRSQRNSNSASASDYVDHMLTARINMAF